MDSRELRYILTLAEYKNMTRAAEALFISQSALSHYVKNVEDALGVRLFDRSTSLLCLTPAGQCYIESAQRILLEESKLVKELRDITHHMHGTLKIGMAIDRISYMLPRLAPRFTELYPSIELQASSGSGQKLLEALRKGDTDFVFLSDGMDYAQHGLESELLYTEEMVLAIRKELLPEGVDRVIPPEMLKTLPFYLMAQGHSSRAFCDTYFRRMHIHPQVAMELYSNISCYRMASTGKGAAIIPYMITRLVKPDENVKVLSLGNTPAVWDIRILYRKGAYIGQPESDLIRISKEEFVSEKLYHE